MGINSYVLTPLAKDDIFEIWSFIARDSESAADRVEQAIHDGCSFVAAEPGRGHSRLDLTKLPVRFWTLTEFPNYSIVYRPETSPLQVTAVLHGKRNLKRVLREPGRV